MSIQYPGGTIVNTTFTAANKGALQSSVASNLVTAGWSQATGPTPGANTVTLTLASPGVVNLAAHGLVANDPVVFATSGALPTGLSAGTVYYVKTVTGSGTFTVSGSAGGTVINFTVSQSGVQTMVGCIRMATTATPWSVTARVRISDYGGTCLNFAIENSNSTLVGGGGANNGGYLNPNSSSTTFRIVANKYQAFIFGAVSTPARSFVAFGTPYLPTFLQGVLTECGWLVCNANSDSDTSLRSSLRTSLYQGSAGTTASLPNNQAIANAVLIDAATVGGGNSYFGCVRVCGTGTGQTVASQVGLLWHDNSALMMEPLIGWGNAIGTGLSSQTLIRGQLWGAVLICNSFTGDTTTTFDGHTWINLTDASGDLGAIFLQTN